MFPFFLRKTRLAAAFFAGSVLLFLAGSLFTSCDQPTNGDPKPNNEVILPAGLNGYFQTPVSINLYNDPYFEYPPSGTFWDDGFAVDPVEKTFWYYTDSTMESYWGGNIVYHIPESGNDPAILFIQITAIAGDWYEEPPQPNKYHAIMYKNLAVDGDTAIVTSAYAYKYGGENQGVAALAEAIEEYTVTNGYYGTTGTYNKHPVTATTLAAVQGKWEDEGGSGIYIKIQGTTIIFFTDDDGDGEYSYMEDDYCTAVGEIVDYTGNGSAGIMYVRVFWSDDYDIDDYLAVGWRNKTGNNIDFLVSADEKESLAAIKTSYPDISSLESDDLGTFTKE